MNKDQIKKIIKDVLKEEFEHLPNVSPDTEHEVISEQFDNVVMHLKDHIKHQYDSYIEKRIMLRTVIELIEKGDPFSAANYIKSNMNKFGEDLGSLDKIIIDRVIKTFG